MPDATIVKCCRVRPGQDADIDLPRYMTPHSAGMDICAAVEQPTTMKPGEIILVPSGFAISLPTGYEAQIRPRSGLAIKHGIGIINSPGTIDADYRGEVKIALINFGKEPYVVNRRDRIAQMVINQVCQARFEVVETLEETDRNSGGFGHTGI
ncbi:MAG: dUTP diphosphatase [Desulfobacteraceae bacterium]|jgi:dUTP pyrophosphatase|nr:dUTP diphosphatase [Desulfobacteraceae bacterium]